MILRFASDEVLAAPEVLQGLEVATGGIAVVVKTRVVGSRHDETRVRFLCKAADPVVHNSYSIGHVRGSISSGLSWRTSNLRIRPQQACRVPRRVDEPRPPCRCHRGADHEHMGSAKSTSARPGKLLPARQGRCPVAPLTAGGLVPLPAARLAWALGWWPGPSR